MHEHISHRLMRPHYSVVFLWNWSTYYSILVPEMLTNILFNISAWNVWEYFKVQSSKSKCITILQIQYNIVFVILTKPWAGVLFSSWAAQSSNANLTRNSHLTSLKIVLKLLHCCVLVVYLQISTSFEWNSVILSPATLFMGIASEISFKSSPLSSTLKQPILASRFLIFVVPRKT